MNTFNFNILSLCYNQSFAVPRGYIYLVLDDELLDLQEDGHPGLSFGALHDL